jgi:sporulation protein YlmC with PRC-barrel domain
MARDSVTRGLRDEADVGPDPRGTRELKRLSELRYKVADGEPDVRGWKVFASTGRELGVVRDLLVDIDAGEVVMLDVDLRRNDRHTLAPIRAAWIDHATQRVVLDAREADRVLSGDVQPDAATADAAATGTATTGAAHRATVDDDDDGVPALPRGGTLSDDDVRRFNDGYARAYGARGVDTDRDYRLRRGDEELRFGGPRRLLDTGATAAAAGAAGAAAARPAGDVRFAESDHINAELSARSVDAARRSAARDEPPGTMPVGQRDASRDDLRGDVRAGAVERDDLAARAAAADARFDLPIERRTDRVDGGEVRALDDSQGIDPRELDGRVRIDEGATVDERTPVGGVRYEGDDPVPHRYGQPADAYGPEHGDGRIGFNRVVSRGPYVADPDRLEGDARDADDRPVRYRRYSDAPADGRSDRRP